MRVRYYIEERPGFMGQVLDFEMSVRDAREAERRRASLQSTLKLSVHMEVMSSRGNSKHGRNHRWGNRTTIEAPSRP